MKKSILKAKIKRNNLEEYSGSYFIDETSKIIKTLNSNEKKALVGIERKDGVYTILGEKFVYYSTVSGGKGQVPLKSFSDILHDNAMKKGKLFAKYKFIKINDKEKVWLNNKLTMNALWNIVLWLEKLDNKSSD